MVRVAQHLFEKEPCLLDIAGTSKTLDVPESAYVECALASPQSIDSSVAGIAVDQAVSKDLFNIGQEVESAHRAIQQKRGRDAIIAQPAYESRCFPVAVWHLIDEPFALRSPAIKAGHLGGGSSLIDENKLLRIKG